MQHNNGILVVRSKDGKGQAIRKEEDFLTKVVLISSFAYDSIVQCLAYKRVVVKVCPVSETIPLGIRIVRQFSEDPLKTLPSISSYLPLFILGTHLTKERIESIGLLSNNFLWPEKRQLVAQVLLLNKKGLA